jgi:hypothetical protein
MAGPGQTDLGGVGQVEYNGALLEGPYCKTKVTATPEWSESGRVIKWWKYTFDISTLIFGGTTGLQFSADHAIEAMRRKLTEPAGLLKYKGVGIGDDFEVGPADTRAKLRDVNFGPKPELLTFLPINAQVVFVQFRVSTCVAEQCFTTAAALPTNVLAVDWDWSTDIDRDGYTVVRWNIGAELPLWMKSDNALPANADFQLRERLAPPLLTGFRREQSWTLSRDRRRLEGRVTDTEEVVALPDGIGYMEMDHDVSSGRSRGQGAFFRWTNTIRGTVNVPRNMTKDLAWDKIKLVLGARLATARGITAVQAAALALREAWANRNASPSPNPAQAAWENAAAAAAAAAASGPAVTQRAVIVTSLSFGEKVFGREVRFSMTYDIIGTSMHNVLNDSGLFRIPGTDWATWKNSMTGTGKPFDVRGCSNLTYGQTIDGAVIDLCHQRKQLLPQTLQANPPPAKR